MHVRVRVLTFYCLQEAWDARTPLGLVCTLMEGKKGMRAQHGMVGRESTTSNSDLRKAYGELGAFCSV